MAETHCPLCSAPFTATYRKHHCRLCLSLVCSECSPYRHAALGERKNQRLCKLCNAGLTNAQQVLTSTEAFGADHIMFIVHILEARAPPAESPAPTPTALSRTKEPFCRVSVAGKTVLSTRGIKWDKAAGGGAVEWAQHQVFRVRAGCRAGDHMVVEVLGMPWLAVSQSAAEVIAHCRVPLYTLAPFEESDRWHALYEVGGVALLGRVRVRVKREGGPLMERPSCSLPYAAAAAPPADEQNNCEANGGGGGGGSGGGGGGGSGGARNPRLDSFYPPGSALHRRLFHQTGPGLHDYVPRNEEVLEAFSNVLFLDGRARPSDLLAGSGGGGGSGADGGGGGGGSGSGGGGSSSVFEAFGSSLTSFVNGGASTSASGASTPNGISGGGGAESVASFTLGEEEERTEGGALVLTTHRLLFVGRSSEARAARCANSHAGLDIPLLQVPLALVCHTRVKRRWKNHLVSVQLDLRDGRTLCFALEKGSLKGEDLADLQSCLLLRDHIKWLGKEDNFAVTPGFTSVDAAQDPTGALLDPLAPPLSMGEAEGRGFPSLYSIEEEFARQGLLVGQQGCSWRYTWVNRDFRLCASYPRQLVVPATVEDQADLFPAARERSLGRIPVLTWLHPVTKAALCRSSAPANSSPANTRVLRQVRDGVRPSLPLAAKILNGGGALPGSSGNGHENQGVLTSGSASGSGSGASASARAANGNGSMGTTTVLSICSGSTPRSSSPSQAVAAEAEMVCSPVLEGEPWVDIQREPAIAVATARPLGEDTEMMEMSLLTACEPLSLATSGTLSASSSTTLLPLPTPPPPDDAKLASPPGSSGVLYRTPPSSSASLSSAMTTLADSGGFGPTQRVRATPPRGKDANSGKKLRIIDARPYLHAKALNVAGKGSQSIEAHDNFFTSYVGMGNVNVQRTSMEALVAAVDGRDEDWYLGLHKSQWVHKVGAVLRGATEVARFLSEGDPVLVHCTDGWDRTSQLASTAQILLDPFFRTLQGLAVLIEKDWCSFGHQFDVRTGYKPTKEARPGNFSSVTVGLASDEASPVFVQWLDAVWQLTQQFPHAFEFNEELLIFLKESVYSRWWSDLRYNSDRERVLAATTAQRFYGKCAARQLVEARTSPPSGENGAGSSTCTGNASDPSAVNNAGGRELSANGAEQVAASDGSSGVVEDAGMVSLWKHVFWERERFTNPLYDPRVNAAGLEPRCGVRCLHVWHRMLGGDARDLANGLEPLREREEALLRVVLGLQAELRERGVALPEPSRLAARGEAIARGCDVR